MSTRDHEDQRDNRIFGIVPKPLAYAAGGVAVAAIVGLNSIETIGETERGLVYTFGKLTTQESSQILQPGLQFKAPFVQSIRKIPVGVNEVMRDPVNIYTQDSQDLNAIISYQFQIPEESLIEIAEKLPTNAQIYSIVENTVMQALKDSFGQTEATDVPQKRNETMQRATENADSLLYRSWKINVPAINMPNFVFNDAFAAAIVRATEMKAEAERARQEVEKVRAEAASALAQAEGQANAIRTTADANLYATQKTADGTLYATEQAAKGQTVLIEAIGAENLPAYWFTQAWNGQTPQVLGGENVAVTDLSKSLVPPVNTAAPVAAMN